MKDIDELLDRVLPSVADEMPVCPDLANVRHRARATPASRARRPVPWLALAAASVVVLGVAGLVFASRRDGANAPADAVTVPPVDPAAPVNPSVPVQPSVPPPVPVEDPISLVPETVGVLNPALGLGEPIRGNPYEEWLYADRVDGEQWFVRADVAGAPTGGIRIADGPATEWFKSFNDGTPIDLGSPVDARVMADSRAPTIGWRTDDGVRTMVGVGDVDLTALSAIARTVAPGLAGSTVSIPGFVSSAIPMAESSVSYDDAGVGLTISRPADGERLDARTTAFMTLVGDARPAGAAWVAQVGGGSVAVVDLDATTQAVIRVDDAAQVDPVGLIDAIEYVSPQTVAVRPSGLGASDPTYEWGTFSAGRWTLASRWTTLATRAVSLRRRPSVERDRAVPRTSSRSVSPAADGRSSAAPTSSCSSAGSLTPWSRSQMACRSRLPRSSMCTTAPWCLALCRRRRQVNSPSKSMVTHTCARDD